MDKWNTPPQPIMLYSNDYLRSDSTRLRKTFYWFSGEHKTLMPRNSSFPAWEEVEEHAAKQASRFRLCVRAIEECYGGIEFFVCRGLGVDDERRKWCNR